MKVADLRHAAVMSSLLKSSAWLMLPTLLHVLQVGRPEQASECVSLGLALMQFYWGWRCLFDAHLFAQLAAVQTNESALDEMLAFLFGRKPRQSPTIMSRLIGARRLWRQFLAVSLAYWLIQVWI